MPIVYPKKIDLPVFMDLSKHMRSFKQPDKIYSISFGKRYKKLLDNGLLEYSTTRYSKRGDKMIFTLGENTVCEPFETGRGIAFKIKKISERFDNFDL